MNRHIIMLLIAFIGTSNMAEAQRRAKKKADTDTYNWRYELECVNVGAPGSYLVKVWSYSNNPKVAMEQAKKNAVHGVIFKGFVGSTAGCTQKPLTNKPALEQEQEIFFRDFFADGGKYMKFVNVTGDGSIRAGDVAKVSRSEYKIGVVVSVAKDALRKDLEAAGIIRGLSSGF